MSGREAGGARTSFAGSRSARLPRAAARLGARSRRERRTCSARRWSRRSVPRWLATRAAAGSPPSTRSCRRRRASASSAGSARQAGRPDGRDPAADRPCRARRRRLRGARRADALARLRRPPGRRRHPLRGDLRGVRRGLPRARPDGTLQAPPASVAAVSVGVVDGAPLLDLDYAEDSRRTPT